MIPGAIQLKLFTIVMLALMNYLLLKKNKNTKETIQSFTPQNQITFNINPQTKQKTNNLQTKSKQLSNTQYSEKNAHNNHLEKSLLKNQQQALNILRNNECFARNQKKNFNQNEYLGKNIQPSLLNDQNKHYQQINTQKTVPMPDSVLNSVYNPININNQSLNHANNPIYASQNKSNNPFDNIILPKSQQRPFNPQIFNNRNIFTVRSPKQSVLISMPEQPMQIEYSNNQHEKVCNLSSKQKNYKTSKKQKKNRNFSERQFLDDLSDSQQSQQSQIDKATIQINSYKKRQSNQICKNCNCSKNKEKILPKQSLKRCLQDLVYTALQQMIEKDGVQKTMQKKKKKASL